MTFLSRSLVALAPALLLAACGGDPAGATATTDGAGGTGPSSSSTGDTTNAGTGGAGVGGAAATTSSTGTGNPTIEPPLGGASGGSGGPAPVDGAVTQAGNVTYRLIVPGSYAAATPSPLLVVYSGTEGGAAMTQNLLGGAAAYTKTDGFIRAVLDGVVYNGVGEAGATVLDDVRAHYNVDNDRTYLLGESAGTSAALELGFHLRQSWFAAFWANDVNATDEPGEDAATLGFAPWGQAGPGGDFPDANVIVSGMKAAGYRLPATAPYAGTGAGQHGSPDQFLAALSWFPGKSRN